MLNAYPTLDHKLLARCGGAGGFACVFCAKGHQASIANNDGLGTDYRPALDLVDDVG